MTLTAPTAVSCPNCGVGLQVLGGGRVTVHYCTHCGSELDAIDSYRVLKTFANLVRPATPFAIGSKGSINGVDWVVIGILGQTEQSPGKSWHWVDHQLYSPTHGYAWLSLENNHLTFTRRFRRAVHPAWLTPAEVEAAETRPVIRAAGESFTYYETSLSQVNFAEGEFTWRVGVGDRTQSISLTSGTSMLTLSETGAEREVELTTYLSQPEMRAAFGVYLPEPLGPHPLLPLKDSPNGPFLLRVSLAAMAICLLLSMVFAGMQGALVRSRTEILPQDMPKEVTFEVQSLRGLTSVYLETSVRNAWAWTEVSLTDPEGTPVFVAGREIGFYEGSDSEGRWTEGSQTTVLSFRPASTGEYTLELDVPETGVDETGKKNRTESLWVTVYSGGASPFWTLAAALLFALVPAYHLLRAYLHAKAQSSGSDWSDDDE